MKVAFARLFLVAAVGICLGSASRSARAFCRSKTCGKDCTTDPVTMCPSEGEPIAWAGSCLSYSVQRDGLPAVTHDDLRSASDAAFRAWQEASCPSSNAPPSISVRDLFGVTTCGRVEYNARQANANIIVIRDTWDAPNNVLAITTVSFGPKTGEIFDADMEINGLLPLSTGPLEPNKYDLQSIITHEAGHFLGLAHSTKNCPDGATMCPKADPGTDDFRTLDDDDVAGICTIYPPDRNAPACDPRPFKGFSPECGMDPLAGGACSLAHVPAGGSARTTGVLVLGCSAVAARLRRAKRATPRSFRRQSLSPEPRQKLT